MCASPWFVEVEPMARGLIAKNEIIYKNWMYTVSANADERISCPEMDLSNGHGIVL
jgi:hypothetical protein